MKSKVYFLLLLLLNAAPVYSATFKELKAPESRRLLYSYPDNFKGGAVIFFHGATGNAQGLLNDAPTADMIQKMFDAGFLVILPEARQDFILGPYTASWESNTVTNPDTQFIDWIMTIAKEAIPELKSIYLMGGSNGVSMGSRVAKNHKDIAGLIAINGPDADQYLISASGAVTLNETFSIPATHAPILLITSKKDGLMTFASKQQYIQKARQAGISVMAIVNEYADHNWGEWTMQYHDDIVGWMKK